ncbi:MAG: glycoside hydrolase family 30 protein [Muribaculaceae bacterium]|nr:glycoside hydrolase family 30 protein [Muribaculaceae bacterium]
MKTRHLITYLLLTLIVAQTHAIEVKWFFSTSQLQWQEATDFQVTAFQQDQVYDALITRYKEQKMLGFGGCFGELGWDALKPLNNRERIQVLNQLFNTTEGANLNFCRTPIGANDFARDYYSLNDYDGDFAMKHFSVNRDKKGLIPYIKAALEVNPNLRLWACPWTPPTWMKINHHYATKAGNGNGYPGSEMVQGQDQFIMQDNYLAAYASYFSKYLTAYSKEGININMIMFQNEPYTINIWPNCSWSAQGSARFIGSFLGPMLKREHKNVELWHGTMNTDHEQEVLQVIDDATAGKYITGAGFQWEGKDIVGKIHRLHPDMPLMCTENECGDGSNDWASAERTFDSMKHYIDNGASSYMYFNMVLKLNGTSSWGWKQNSLVVVDTHTHQVTYTPEYYLMKHMSRYLQAGSYKLKTMGNDQGMLAFRNPDGSTIVIVANKRHHDRDISIALNDNVIKVKLQAKSFNTFIIN